MVKFFTSLGGSIRQVESLQDKCWIDMINPSDDECEDIALNTGVSEDLIKAALDEEERARTEIDGTNKMFIVDCPIIEEDEDGVDNYSTLPLAIIYNSRFVITVCLKGNTALKDFATGRDAVKTAEPVQFALTFLLSNAKRFLYCLKQIDRKTRRIQSEMEKTMRNTEIIQLLDLQNSLVYFSTSLNSNERVYEKFYKIESSAIVNLYDDLYEDIGIENRQAIETCNIYKSILSVTMDAYGSVISNNANNTMKTLTIITILLAVPTMIAGFWGMNMPVPFQDGYTFAETGWFWLVMFATIAVTIIIGIFLLRSNPFKKGIRKKKRRDKKPKD